MTDRALMSVGRIELSLAFRTQHSELLEVVCAACKGLPVAGREPRHHVFAECEAGRSVDRELIVVVEDNEFSQTEMARERCRFVHDPFHHVAIAGQNIGVMIDDAPRRRVELRRQHTLGDRDSDRVAEPLSQRSRGCLDPWRRPIFRMSGRLRAQRSEPLEVLEAEVVAGQVQQGVQEHRPVAGGQDETVPVRPEGVLRIVTHRFTVDETAELRAS